MSWHVVVKFPDGVEVRGTDTPSYPSRAAARRAAHDLQGHIKAQVKRWPKAKHPSEVLVYGSNEKAATKLIPFDQQFGTHPDTRLKI